MIGDWYRVRYDEHGVYRDVRPPNGERWEDSFAWTTVIRVCFIAHGLFDSDELFVFTSERDESYQMPTEADGTLDLIDELIRRGLIPATVMIEAALSEDQLFCWPPPDVEPEPRRRATR